jgi:hypothetical protein
MLLLHLLEPGPSSAVAWTGAAGASAGSLLLQYSCQGRCSSSAVARTVYYMERQIVPNYSSFLHGLYTIQ